MEESIKLYSASTKPVNVLEASTQLKRLTSNQFHKILSSIIIF
jgi:hypothetical protein